MALAARVGRWLWPRRCALADRLGSRPWPPLLTPSRAGFAGLASSRQGRPRLLGTVAVALGGTLGLYHTVRWHLRAQDLRAELSAAQVRPCRDRLDRSGRPREFAPTPDLLAPTRSGIAFSTR